MDNCCGKKEQGPTQGSCKNGSNLPERRQRHTYDVKKSHPCDDYRILLQGERRDVREAKLCESGVSGNPESEFVKILIKLLIKTLNIGWNDQRIFTSVLEKAIGDRVKDLLEDYLDYWVEIYGKELGDKFNLDENVKPNYTYAQHARLWPVIEAAIEKYKNDKCKCDERKAKRKKKC